MNLGLIIPAGFGVLLMVLGISFFLLFDCGILLRRWGVTNPPKFAFTAWKVEMPVSVLFTVVGATIFTFAVVPDFIEEVVLRIIRALQGEEESSG